MKEGFGKGWKIWVAVTGGVVVTIVLVAAILGLTVFKLQQPISTVDNIKIQDMDLSFNVFSMNVNLNVTLGVDVSVRNPNKFGLKYYDGSAQLNYNGTQIGHVPIPNGEISARETKGVNMTLTIMADRLFANSKIYSDVTSGTLPLNSFMRIYGEVKILGFKFHSNSSSTCDFIVNISNRTIDNKVCKYDV